MTRRQISISLQTYNRGQSGFLRLALEGILGQTHGDFELLVIDNHSTDDTPDIVLACKDPPLTYLRLPPGGTPADSIRAAFRASQGEYLLTTHDDDIMEPDMLARQMACITAHPELLCLAANVSLIDQSSNTIQSRLYEMESDRLFIPGDYIETYFREKLWFPTPTLLFRRDAVASGRHSFARKPGRPDYFPSGDIAGLFRLNAKGCVGILAAPLLRYRQHPEQESRNVHQSNPLVILAQHAERLVAAHRKNERLRALLPMTRAFSVRYQAQDALFTLAGETLRRKLKALKQGWEKRISPDSRAVDAVLPFEILLLEMQLGNSIPLPAFRQLAAQPASSGSQSGYRRWLQLLHEGKPLFSGTPDLKRIVIFGSMLTAHLLVLAARKRGIAVLCCVDSSKSRIGNKVLDIPIAPLEALEKISHLDAVILSSERDHEDGLKNMLHPWRERSGFRILSWKDLTIAPPCKQEKLTTPA